MLPAAMDQVISSEGPIFDVSGEGMTIPFNKYAMAYWARHCEEGSMQEGLRPHDDNDI